MNVHIDIETRSRAKLKKVGTDIYAHDPSTEILMAAYAFDDGPVFVWEPRLGPIPEELKSALTDLNCIKYAWNVAFEFILLSVKLNLVLDIKQWRDPMAHARYLAYPGSLDGAGDALGIDLEYAKSSTGKKLIKLFSEPTRATKKKLSVFRDWDSNPEEWQQFVSYCKQDVISERQIAKELDVLCPFPAQEQLVWQKDQEINMRGIPIDLDFAGKALALVEAERTNILLKMKELTGCENPNSPQQIKDWLAGKGYELNSLSKDIVAAMLKTDLDLNVKELLELKQILGGIAFKKLPVIQMRTREDRLRGAFTYHSAHTGRWASHGVQWHNLLKPTKRASENMDFIVESVLSGSEWPDVVPVIEGVSGALRATVRAAQGCLLYVADYSSIENRVLAWITECPGMLSVFKQGLDPYKSFASKFFNKNYDDVTKEERDFCKPPVLGCGFSMGGKRLVAYALALGQVISEDQADKLVYAWREMYPEVVDYWAAISDSCMQAVAKKQHLRLGPLKLDGRDSRMFHITLPNGRQLNYPEPEIGRDKWFRPVLTHMTEMKEGWLRTEAAGGLLTENIVQAIARDILVNGMFNVESAGFKIVLHVHDELVSEIFLTDINQLPYTLFEELMVKPPKWGLDIPIAAEGYQGIRYKKG